MARAYVHCNVCDGVMDEVETITAHREVHDELDGRPSEWIYERHCIYCGADDQFLEDI